MNTVRTNVYAKINLTLDLLGKEGEYHLLDSLVCTVDLCDRVTVRRRKDALSSVVMRGMGSEEIPPERNNALRAAEAFSEAFGTAGAEISIDKNIPIGAGFGGSSADAAGTLIGMAKLYGIDPAELKTLADSLGSDTGYLLTGGFARLGGRGERVEPLGPVPAFHLLLLCPMSGVSTAACYRKSDEFSREEPRTERALECLRSGNAEWAAKLFGNGLFRAAEALNPDVGAAARELKEFSPQCVNMTGSGSAVYALFETEELCAWAKSRYRGKFRPYVLKTVDPNAEESRSVWSAGK